MSQKSNEKELVACRGLVKGRVQGVFFRAETRRQAEIAGACGWVRNTVEGHVEVHVEGRADAVNTMRQWLLKGPGLARVDALMLDEVAPQHYGNFVIRQ